MVVNFYIYKSRPDTNGECLITTTISIMGARYQTSLRNVKMHPEKWDEKRQVMRKGANNLQGYKWNVINTYLTRIKEHFQEYANKCLLSEYKPTKTELQKEFYRHFRKDKPIKGSGGTFADCFDEFLVYSQNVKRLRIGSLNIYEHLQNNLLQWNDKPTFAHFDENGLNNFVVFLRDKGMAEGTIDMYISRLKCFLKWARRKGYHNIADFEEWQPHLTKQPHKVIFLTWEELMKVYNTPINRGETDLTMFRTDGKIKYKAKATRGAVIARDMFLFCCFTSLRVSDAQNLKKSDLQNGKISITTIKTSKAVTIELNKYALQIAEKYKNYKDLGGYFFPHVGLSYYNMAVRAVCAFCGIDEPITKTIIQGGEKQEITKPKYLFIGSHTARRTFIVNALSMGIPPQIVMKWTGHTKYDGLTPYIDIAGEAKEKAMQLFNER